MPETLLEWRNYRYFPYERDFARLETERLFSTACREDNLGIRIGTDTFTVAAAKRLTYFARAVHSTGKVVVPRQTLLEASARPTPSERQATRYSAHALHEYKGRFNPQVVRAIGNIIGLRADAAVLDPFCGGGTTLLESAHSGWSAVGIDRNPLAIRIANAKLHAIRRPGDHLERLARDVVNSLDAFRSLSANGAISRNRIEAVLGIDWERELPSFAYLQAWFPRSVLAQIVVVRRAIKGSVRSTADREILEVILSDQLRAVSLQEPLDLRIRRRKDYKENYPLVEIFARAVEERLARVVRARLALGTIAGQQKAILGDTRMLVNRRMSAPAGGFDAIITSPPYETALPYIDTQRLSLVLFGDIKASEIASTEGALIGAREISTLDRQMLEEAIRNGSDNLPHEVTDFGRELLAAAALPGNGFRRRNRPALMYRYFTNMAAFFVSVRGLMRPGAPIALVIGSNRTTLGGKEFCIDTPRLLRAVAVRHGFSPILEQPMDTYPRYDLHHQNAIESETLLVLSAPETATKRGKIHQVANKRRG